MLSVLALLSFPLAVRADVDSCTSSSLGCVPSAGAQSLLQVTHKQEQVSTAKSLDNALSLVEGLAEKDAAIATWDGHNTSMSEEEKTALQTIKSFIDDLFATLSTGHSEDQAEVNRVRALVQSCTDNTKTGLDGDVSTLKSTAADTRKDHGECREAEIIAFNNRTSLCNAYDMHRKTAGNAPPTCMLTDLTKEFIKTSDDVKQAKMENCLESTNTWLNALYDLYVPCSEARVTYTNKVAECWTEQTEFEGAFCAYEAKLVSICDSQDSCRTTNLDAYEDTVKDVNVSEMARVADHKVGQKIRCLFGVFEAANAEKPGKLKECKDATLSNLPKEIEYPPAPDAHTCNREQDWPCKAAWTKAEYDDQTWWNSDLDMKVCTVCTQYRLTSR